MSEAVHDLLKGPRPDGFFVPGDFPLDENVLTNLLSGTKVLSANRYGTSAWTVTARINVELPNNAHARYFLKCAAGDSGRSVMEGEYNATSELYRTMPNFVPKPVAWGSYRVANPDTYYFLSEFIDMSDRTPEPNQLCSKLAQLHRSSVSPTGKFGMHVTTCQGRTPQAVNWESSWTAFFSNLIRHVTKIDFEVMDTGRSLIVLRRLYSTVSFQD